MVSQVKIKHFNIEERFSRFLKALASSYYNRVEVSSYLALHTHSQGSGSQGWHFHIKQACVVVQDHPFRIGHHNFNCDVEVYPNLTINNALFPQYIKPEHSRRDNLRKDSEIALFKKEDYLWRAPAESGDEFYDESWQLLIVPDNPATAASLSYCLKLTHKATGTKYSIRVIVRRGERPHPNDEVLEWTGFSLTHRQQAVYGGSPVARF